jgi:transposase
MLGRSEVLIKMDCLYYDITSTTYFEGKKCIIARLGYSRDGKPDM